MEKISSSEAWYICHTGVCDDQLCCMCPATAGPLGDICTLLGCQKSSRACSTYTDDRCHCCRCGICQKGTTSHQQRFATDQLMIRFLCAQPYPVLCLSNSCCNASRNWPWNLSIVSALGSVSSGTSIGFPSTHVSGARFMIGR